MNFLTENLGIESIFLGNEKDNAEIFLKEDGYVYIDKKPSIKLFDEKIIGYVKTWCHFIVWINNNEFYIYNSRNKKAIKYSNFNKIWFYNGNEAIILLNDNTLICVSGYDDARIYKRKHTLNEIVEFIHVGRKYEMSFYIVGNYLYLGSGKKRKMIEFVDKTTEQKVDFLRILGFF